MKSQEIQIAEAKRSLVRAKINLINELKGSFFKFFKFFWSEIQTEEYSHNWHIEYICDELEYLAGFLFRREPKPYDLIINIPVGASKSSIVSQAYPVWLWINDPTLILITASGADSLVQKNAEKSRGLIMSKKFNDLFGEQIKFLKSQNKVKYYGNEEKGFRISVSAGSNIIGEHAHVHIYDDPIDTEGVLSKAVVEKVNRWLQDKLATRFTDKRIAPRILVMQRLAVGDPTDTILKKSVRVKQISLPAKLDKDTQVLPIGEYWKGKPLESYYRNSFMDPVRKDQEALDQYLADLGPVAYNAQLQMAPKPKEGIIIKDKMIHKVKIYELPADIWNIPYSYFADTSYTKKESNDPNGMLKTKKYNNTLYVFDYLGFREEAIEAIKVFSDYIEADGQIGPIYIENKASGLTYAQLLRTNGFSAIDFMHDGQDKEARLRYCSMFFKSKRVVFVEGDYLAAFLDVLKSFPKVPHDEEVDVMCMACINELERNYERQIA